MVGIAVDEGESVVVVVIATAIPTVVVTFSGPTPDIGGGIFVGAWPTAEVGATAGTAAVGVTLGETTPNTDAISTSRLLSSTAMASKAEKSEPEWE